MNQVRGHAVVLGASMGGLLAARSLSDFYERVTVVERDELPPDARNRKGVPQGRHLHVLLQRGAEAFERLFPGLTRELAEAGAPRSQVLREARLVLSGHELAAADTGAFLIQLTRPLLESTVRERVAALPGVKIMDGFDAVGLRVAGARVTGARIRNRRPGSAEEVVEADLVVDAMGRGGRTAAWLPLLGYRPPDEDRIKIDVTYLTRFLHLAEGTPAAGLQLLVGPVPGKPRGFGLFQQEGGRWVLTFAGMAGEVPAHGDEESHLAYAETVAPPEVAAALRAAVPVTEFVTHRFPTSIRRRYERLGAFPRGLMVFGDALCSFNPVYGQGMTVAALEAEALRDCLRAGERDLARRFFRAAAKVIDPAWQLSAAGDLALPEIPGPRPPATRIINRYVARMHRVAAHDPVVARSFARVSALLDPPRAIFAPRILARVLGSRK
jgi:2-polyprenyl-6-methoxyphenol hydroxylase-like FAD-dependent oxidoreductase